MQMRGVSMRFTLQSTAAAGGPLHSLGRHAGCGLAWAGRTALVGAGKLAWQRSTPTHPSRACLSVQLVPPSQLEEARSQLQRWAARRLQELNRDVSSVNIHQQLLRAMLVNKVSSGRV